MNGKFLFLGRHEKFKLLQTLSEHKLIKNKLLADGEVGRACFPSIQSTLSVIFMLHFGYLSSRILFFLIFRAYKH